MIEAFFIVLLIGYGVSLLTAPVGCLIVWRKMSFLADSIAHVSMLAYIISHLTGWPVIGCVVAVSVSMSVLADKKPSSIPQDAWLLCLSSVGIALTLLGVTIGEGNELNAMHMFIGDIMLSSWSDVGVIWIIAVFLGVHLYAFWRSFIFIIFQPDLARLEGVPIKFMQMIIQIILGGAVAIALKTVGVLLVGTLLVVPTIAARPLVRSPSGQVLGAGVMSVVATTIGISLSFYMDVAPGPLIILSLILMLGAVYLRKFKA